MTRERLPAKPVRAREGSCWKLSSIDQRGNDVNHQTPRSRRPRVLKVMRSCCVERGCFTYWRFDPTLAVARIMGWVGLRVGRVPLGYLGFRRRLWPETTTLVLRICRTNVSRLLPLQPQFAFGTFAPVITTLDSPYGQSCVKLYRYDIAGIPHSGTR